jgi:hypothetical protein
MVTLKKTHQIKLKSSHSWCQNLLNLISHTITQDSPCARPRNRLLG